MQGFAQFSGQSLRCCPTQQHSPPYATPARATKTTATSRAMERICRRHGRQQLRVRIRVGAVQMLPQVQWCHQGHEGKTKEPPADHAGWRRQELDSLVRQLSIACHACLLLCIQDINIMFTVRQGVARQSDHRARPAHLQAHPPGRAIGELQCLRAWTCGKGIKKWRFVPDICRIAYRTAAIAATRTWQ